VTVELSYYNRLEPRPRDNDLAPTLANEVRDPFWFLARQWQMGEFAGEDAGSIAFAQYAGQVSKVPRWLPATGETALSPEAPLERQTLREPFTPDIGTQVELGQDFEDYLRAAVGDATAENTLLSAIRGSARFAITPLPTADLLNPPDAASQRFLEVCAGNSQNGYELYVLGKNVAAGSETIPSDITTDPTRVAQLTAALANLVVRVESVLGEIGPADPVTWQPDRLEYAVDVIGVDPSGQGNATLAAYPDGDGEFEWYAFDVAAKDAAAVEEAPAPVNFTIIPTRVRFSGMPASRLWAFEENTVSLPDIAASKTSDVLKLLVTDFLNIHANDWHVLPYDQVPGTLAFSNYIVVHDVFGKLTSVRIAAPKQSPTETSQWAMFRIADRSDPTAETLSNFFLLPQSSGDAMQLGAVLEDVRFGRDETANMAFGIERVTTNPIGEPHTGRQRDAEVDAARDLPAPAATDSGFPLRYDIESELPASFVPFLPEQLDPANPSIVLRRGANELATHASPPAPVTPLTKILKPVGVAPYRIAEEELPRAGVRVERVVYRARWTDGSTHLWVQRRRRVGAGETSSGLRFDRALPNQD
jgi:hypothetical protein